MSNDLRALLIDGVVLTREVLACGIHDGELTRAVAAGTLARIMHGAYADARNWRQATPEDRHRLRCTAVLRRYGDHVALSHQSAVLRHGGPTWGLDLDLVHLTHLRGNGRREAGICHHVGGCRPDELVMVGNQLATDVTRTVLDIVTTCDTEPAIVVANYFFHEQVTNRELVLAANAERPRWAGTLSSPLALGLCDARIESVGESRCWYLFWKSELPMPTPQLEVRDRAGRSLGRVDFVWQHLGIWVEFDGKEKYLRYRRPGESVEDYLIRERGRENQIREATGWDVIRLTWADLHHPERVVERVLDVVARRQRR